MKAGAGKKNKGKVRKAPKSRYTLPKLKNPAHLSLTPKRVSKFLAELSRNGGNVSRAAKTANVSRRLIYLREETDAEFAKEFRAAQRVGYRALEDEARRRAFNGVREPLYYAGKKVASVKSYSDKLLIELLRAEFPEKYRKEAPATAVVNVQMSQADCERFAKERLAELRAKRAAEAAETAGKDKGAKNET